MSAPGLVLCGPVCAASARGVSSPARCDEHAIRQAIARAAPPRFTSANVMVLQTVGVWLNTTEETCSLFGRTTATSWARVLNLAPAFPARSTKTHRVFPRGGDGTRFRRAW